MVADDVSEKPIEIDRVLARFHSPLTVRGPGHLRWENNKVALWELNERLSRDQLPLAE